MKLDNQTINVGLLSMGSLLMKEEASAIMLTANKLDSSFTHALNVLNSNLNARIHFSGVGKSGFIARKIAASFASFGIPSYYTHPTEMLHGDLGSVMYGDVFVALSYSGNTQELVAVIPALKRRGVRIIAITGNPTNNLAELADVHIPITIQDEICLFNVAPTSSTTVMLALGDALCVCSCRSRGLERKDFARNHPGGALGAALVTKVSDLMKPVSALAISNLSCTLDRAILKMVEYKSNILVIQDEQDLVGVFSDSDLRRCLAETSGQPTSSVLIKNWIAYRPKSILNSLLVSEVLHVFAASNTSNLLVVDDMGNLVGMLTQQRVLSSGFKISVESTGDED